MNLTYVKNVALDYVPVNLAYRAVCSMQARAFELGGRWWQAQSARLRGLRASPAPRHSRMAIARARKWLDSGAGGVSRPIVGLRESRFLRDFLRTSEARMLREQFVGHPVHHRIRMREPNDENTQRQGNLIILKEFDETTGEKGAILLKFTVSLRRFAAMFDVAQMASRYAFILEPSSWGYEDPGLFLYVANDADVVVQAPWRRDFDYLTELQTNLAPVRIGAGDWIDPLIFRSDVPRSARRFDLVAVSAWSALKRHDDLFEALAYLRGNGMRVNVALIGYPLDWTQTTIASRARRYGVDDQCTIFDSVPLTEVAQIVGDSRAYVLMSRREGANRALYEALWCNTPVVVYQNHRGVNTDIVREGVGELFTDDALHMAIARVLERSEQYAPRAWAERHSGYRNATLVINESLAKLASSRGLPWTRAIAAKKNAPDLMYGDPNDVQRFANEYDRLKSLLR